MIFLFFVMPFLSISTEQIQQLHKLHQEAQALLEIDTWILRKAQEMQQKYSKIEGLNQQIQKLETLCKISPQIALAPPAQFLGQTLQLQQEQIQQSLKRDLFETQQRLDLEILARGIRPPSNPQRCWIPMALKWISPKASIMVQALSERAGFQIHQSNRQFYWHFYNPTVRAL